MRDYFLYYQIRLGEAKRKKDRLRDENVNPVLKRFEQSAAVELFERLEPATEIAGFCDGDRRLEWSRMPLLKKAWI
jgi:hypothetical protein